MLAMLQPVFTFLTREDKENVGGDYVGWLPHRLHPPPTSATKTKRNHFPSQTRRPHHRIPGFSLASTTMMHHLRAFTSANNWESVTCLTPQAPAYQQVRNCTEPRHHLSLRKMQSTSKWQIIWTAMQLMPQLVTPEVFPPQVTPGLATKLGWTMLHKSHHRTSAATTNQPQQQDQTNHALNSSTRTTFQDHHH